MNTTYPQIINALLRREGGFVNHPADRGRATNMGWTLQSLQNHDIDVNEDDVVDINDVKAVTVEVAMRLYKKYYWDPSRANELPANLRGIYFDMCVNHGQRNAVYILQKAARAEGKDLGKYGVDGAIGDDTIKAVQYLQLHPVVKQRLMFFYKIVLNDPSQKVFLKGWVNRCFEFL